ncbi:GGDEF domain-containing protein [Kineosporia sp. NBRC 101731]|uniref:GGDEF domain-containing protein n=1 Tax=Kineosporia sp. NBRC 101731 TaxID=3032199 RepID=UPI00249F9E5F|nr:GGDEF domain-containing protein [Kineosporia sp. NBRC 101731]GLY29316.1 hypothetical protein Kisp02_26810 [Kineosporia sp. NBRC 101731]
MIVLLPRLLLVATGILATLAVAGLTRQSEGTTGMTVAYTSSVGLSSAFLLLAVRRIPAHQRRPWYWLLANMGLCLTGELVLAYYQVIGDDHWPTPADAFFVVAYLTTALGVLGLDAQRRRRPPFGAVLDALIVATGIGVLALVFVVLPLLSDTTQPMAARVVGTVYPLADLLLLFLVMRLFAAGRGAGATVWWVTASMLCTLTADAAQNLIELTSGGNKFAVWMNVVWASAYLCWGFAALNAWRPVHPVTVVEPSDRAEGLTVPRLTVLALAAGLPSVVLIVRTATGRHDGVVLLGLGSMVLLGMVVTRIWILLQDLRCQSDQMALLARTDPLTGLSNRRSWDFDLARAMGTARSTGSVLMVALLDLDHFKTYNDTHGHQAGDELLREAAQAWSAALAPAPVLARWGGEEFAVLTHCSGTGTGFERLDALRAVVPGGQSVSIGMAVWDGEEDAGRLLQRADAALYLAKAGGRDRSVLAEVQAPLDPLDPAESASSVSSAVQSPSSSFSSSVNPTDA